MELLAIDWAFVVGFFIIALLVGVWVTRQAGRSTSAFFLSNREMPWWLLGMSMVATTFSTDTPNLVTDIVRQDGVAGNWVWWAFLLTGMLTVFVYAKLWRRTAVLTDIEFYELRYSGRSAAFLRGFRALYLGIFYNVIIMATVSLAAIKIGGVLLDFSPIQSLLAAGLVTVIFSTMGGFKGVILTDLLLFVTAMVGSVAAAVVALRLPEVGGLGKLVSHPALAGKLSMVPAFDTSTAESTELLIFVFVIPLTVQWWAAWYPSAEPGGGGYIAQRMLAARNERHAVGATLFFNVAHYALRPWPWILVGLCSLIVFPDLAALQARFPQIPADKIGHDLAYPAMLTYLPHGWLGLVLASLTAAYMSTISSHLNWGSSYVVNDFYKRFIDPKADESRLVLVGRIATVIMMILAAALALWLQNALQVFRIILQIGAGTGLLFLLRWFWMRINAWSEITAMAVSFLVAVYFQFLHPKVLPDHDIATAWQFVIGVGITTVAWITVTLLTPATEPEHLSKFRQLVRPKGGRSQLRLGLACMTAGCLAVYGALFATGFLLYGNYGPAALLALAAVGSGVFLKRAWPSLA